MTTSAQGKLLYPEGLLKWAGHSDGGVRLPFFEGLGRPAGKQFITPLVSRMDQWANDIAAGQPSPRIIFLVGGPGNGKTDTVESAVHSLDSAFQLHGALIEAVRDKYTSTDGGIPPRRVNVHLSELGVTSQYKSLSIVQDATETDPQVGMSCEQLLISDLNNARSDETNIYLCCVNRGILAQALRLIPLNGSGDQGILALISEAITHKHQPVSCWPLKGDPAIAAWPMDADSLVKPTYLTMGRIVDQILDEALLESNWKPSCDLGSMCPFCQNRKVLANKTARNSLVDLLYFFELRSGQRWTFRDLFSLFSYLLVGDPKELEIKGKSHPPCTWSAIMFATYKDHSKPKSDQMIALTQLVTRLYHHRLFPIWPSFSKGNIREAKSVLKEGFINGDELDGLSGFLTFFMQKKKADTRISGDVVDRVRSELSQMLDPALAEGDLTLMETSGTTVEIRTIEDLFSVSIQEGKAKVRHQIQSLESRLLDELQEIDLALDTENFPNVKSRDVYLLKGLIRQFAVRLTKRSLGTKYAVCQKMKNLKSYAEAMHNEAALRQILKSMSRLLHDNKNNFQAHLATTFGQPVAERSRDISLLVRKKVNIRPVAIAVGADDTPPQPIPYVKIESHYLGLTFDLFDSLVSVAEGLHPASLPTDTYALLDRVKSLVAGEVVRDQSVIDDDPILILGNGNLHAEYREGRFFIEKANNDEY